MENEANATVAGLLKAIERLCLEKEVAQAMLQVYWPPAETISWYAVLNRNCASAEAEFHSRAPIAKIDPSTIPADQGPCGEFLLKLSEALEQTRLSTFDQVDPVKKTI
jgi:hypothetical protein